jgi:16S rRNA (cytosine967-C5)-methyltransferase
VTLAVPGFDVHNEQAQAARAVHAVFEGANLTAALAAVDDGSELRGRSLVQELAYGTLRHWGMLEALTRRLSTKPISDPLLASLICVAIYQLDHLRTPQFAVVDQAVEAAAILTRPAAKALVNAILRRYLREAAGLHEAAAGDPVARWSYPRWWIARVKADYPHDWQAILAAGNTRPPLSLRVNTRQIAREALLQRFIEAGIPSRAEGAVGLIVDPPRPVAELPGYVDGAFAVQDLGAQLAAPALDLEDGLRVLDACAAPGGKTTHLLELADIDLLALDVDASRLPRLRENVARLEHDLRRVEIACADAGDPSTWWDGRAFDRILLDVPCTASGIVRRHPDGKWLRRASDVAKFVTEQMRLLNALWPLVAPGGKLLYATCSVLVAENQRQITDFLAVNDDALRETLTFAPGIAHLEGQLLPSAEAAGHNQDGFFYALLRKA